MSHSPIKIKVAEENKKLKKRQNSIEDTRPVSMYVTGHLPLKTPTQDFPGGLVVKNPPANAGDMDSVPGL